MESFEFFFGLLSLFHGFVFALAVFESDQNFYDIVVIVVGGGTLRAGSIFGVKMHSTDSF